MDHTFTNQQMPPQAHSMPPQAHAMPPQAHSMHPQMHSMQHQVPSTMQHQMPSMQHQMPSMQQQMPSVQHQMPSVPPQSQSQTESAKPKVKETKTKTHTDLQKFLDQNYVYHTGVQTLCNGHIIYLLYKHNSKVNTVADFIVSVPQYGHVSVNALRMSLHRLFKDFTIKKQNIGRRWDNLVEFLKNPYRFPKKRVATEKVEKRELMEHVGGCHCGAVRFKAMAPRHLDVWDCNCSICKKKQNLHFVVPKENFTLLQGEESITTYTFNSHQAKHTFCKVCGVQSFYTPRSNPDGYGVMPHCLDPGTVKSVKIKKFDGENWEAFIKKSDISKYSKPTS